MWTWLDSETTSDLYGIALSDGLHGLAVGGEGTLLGWH